MNTWVYLNFCCTDDVDIRIFTGAVGNILKYCPSLMLKASSDNCRTDILIQRLSFGLHSKDTLLILQRFWGGGHRTRCAQGFSPRSRNPDRRRSKADSICIFFVHTCMPHRRAMRDWLQIETFFIGPALLNVKYLRLGFVANKLAKKVI